MGILDKTKPIRFFLKIPPSNEETCEIHHHIGESPCPWPSCQRGVEGETIIGMYPGGFGKEHRFERKRWQSHDGKDRFSWVDLTLPIHSMSSKIIKEEVRRSLGADPPFPNTIYHYTNMQGLSGIIDSKEFWLTDHSYMNDSREIEYGLDIVRAAVKDLSSNPKYSQRLRIIEKWEKFLDTGTAYRICIACFSLQGDSLSQWRGYGGRSIGICLCFGIKHTMFWHSLGLNLQRVIYDKEKQFAIAKIILHIYLTIMEWNQQKGTDVDEDIFGSSLITNLYQQLVFFKNPAFSDEKEVRWVYTEDKKMFPGDDTLAPKRFRLDPNILVPYVTSTDVINMFKAKGFPVGNAQSKLLPLQEVIVGPQENEDLVKKSISEYLNEKGYGFVKVRNSEVPFRSKQSR